MVSTPLPSCNFFFHNSKMKCEQDTAMVTQATRWFLLYLLPAKLWAFLTPLSSWLGLLNLASAVWQRGGSAEAKCKQRPGWGNPIDKDTLQARNRCTRLCEAEFSLCWDGCVVIYFGKREMGGEEDGGGAGSGGQRWEWEGRLKLWRTLSLLYFDKAIDVWLGPIYFRNESQETHDEKFWIWAQQFHSCFFSIYFLTF